MNEATTATLAGTTTTHVGTAASAVRAEQRSTGFRHALMLLLATLREIFDESAYHRFLTHHQLNSDRAAYALFLREQETRKARQPKCC
ncbi:MAG: hypothetical protein WB421_16945 [Terriglobales bacterium]|jgi:hypothetical protein